MQAGMRFHSFGLILALICAASGGCTTQDSDIEESHAAEVRTPAPDLSAFVLTVTADVESDIVITATNTVTNTCAANHTCNFAYIAGSSLSISTQGRIVPDCERFVDWDCACVGQGALCHLVINSNLSTTPVYGPISGCVPK